MTKAIGPAVLVLAAALLQGCATDTQLGGTTQVGKVDQVYIEAYPGLFVDRALATAAGDKPQWVSISFAQPLDDGRLSAIAVLGDVSGVEPGDLVQVNFAGNDAFGAGSEPEYNRVISLFAKRDSPAALSFNPNGRTRAPELLSAAVARP